MKYNYFTMFSYVQRLHHVQRLRSEEGFLYFDALVSTIVAGIAILGICTAISSAMNTLHRAYISDKVLQYTAAAMEQGKADYKMYGTVRASNDATLYQINEPYRISKAVEQDECLGIPIHRLIVKGYYGDDEYCTLSTVLWEPPTL